jgi:hypothetical protein
MKTQLRNYRPALMLVWDHFGTGFSMARSAETSSFHKYGWRGVRVVLGPFMFHFGVRS